MKYLSRGGTALLVLFLFSLSPMFAEEAPQKQLTLSAAVSEAVAANLSLKNEELKMSVKRRDRDLSFNRLYPTLSVSANALTLNDSSAAVKPLNSLLPGLHAISSSFPSSINVPPTNLALGLTTQIALSYSAIAGMIQTSIDFDNSKISHDFAQQKLERDVKKVFYQLLVLQETIKLTQRQLDNAQERYNQAKANNAGGLVPELTVLQAQVAYENRKPALEDLKVNYAQLLFGFENFLGRDPDPSLVLVGTLDIDTPAGDIDGNVLVDRYLNNRLDVQAAFGQVKSVEGLRNLQDSLLFPVFVVQYTANPVLNDPWNSATDWKKSSNWLDTSGALSFIVSWKLDSFLPGSTFWNQRGDLDDQVALAQSGLQQTKMAARTEIVMLAQKIKKSVSAQKSLSQNVEAAKRAYKLTEDAYQSGARSLLEVQDAELQYQAAQLTLLSEKQLLNSNLLDLETALNTTREEIYGTQR